MFDLALTRGAVSSHAVAHPICLAAGGAMGLKTLINQKTSEPKRDWSRWNFTCIYMRHICPKLTKPEHIMMRWRPASPSPNISKNSRTKGTTASVGSSLVGISLWWENLLIRAKTAESELISVQTTLVEVQWLRRMDLPEAERRAYYFFAVDHVSTATGAGSDRVIICKVGEIETNESLTREWIIYSIM